MPQRNASPSWLVYLLRCADGSLYCGVARDVAKRVAAHNAGRGARYTRARRPVELAWRKRCRTHSVALQDEYAIKQLTRAEKDRLADGRCRWSRGRLVVGSSPRHKVEE